MQVAQHTGAAARDVPKDHTNKSDGAKHVEVGGGGVPNKEGLAVSQAESGITTTGSEERRDDLRRGLRGIESHQAARGWR